MNYNHSQVTDSYTVETYWREEKEVGMRPISLAAARVDAGMTQAEVARALKVSKNTVVAWEKGTSEPKISQLRSLCNLYNRPVDDIFLLLKSI